MPTIYLVSCGSTKAEYRCPARDLYVSPRFKLARALAEREGDQWYILSGEHGLVHPGQVLQPYNRAVKEMRAAERRQWAGKVLMALDRVVAAGDRVVVLAPAEYREFLVEPLRTRGVTVEVPMEHLNRGEQRAWLCQQVRRNA